MVESRLPEILPPKDNTLVRVGRWSFTPRQIAVGKVLLGTVGLGGAAYWFQNFLQLRGLVNLLASRIDLGLVVLCLLIVAFTLTINIKSKWIWRIVLSCIILFAALALDWWAPKPEGRVDRAPPEKVPSPSPNSDGGNGQPTPPPLQAQATPVLSHRPIIRHLIGGTKTTSVPATQLEEAPPQVNLSFNSNAISDLLRSQTQPLRPILGIETSDDILEDIRGVLEKDRDLTAMEGCSAGESVALRRVGEDISYYVCVKKCFASWAIVNPKRLDFSGIRVSHPGPTLATVEIPCLPPTATTTDYGFCVTYKSGTFTASGDCQKENVKSDYLSRLDIVVHVEHVDSVVKLWKKFSAEIK